MTRVKCDNCSWTGADRGQHTISKLYTRVDPGGTMPSCECPKCGALCYEVKPAKHFPVYIIWGETPEPGCSPLRYDFETPAEAEAFRHGIEASMGWFGATEVSSPRARVKKDRSVDPKWIVGGFSS